MGRFQAFVVESNCGGQSAPMKNLADGVSVVNFRPTFESLLGCATMRRNKPPTLGGTTQDPEISSSTKNSTTTDGACRERGLRF